MSATIHHGDCLEVLAAMADNSVDAIVTDPPYGLSFMGKEWDSPGRMVGQENQGTGKSNYFLRKGDPGYVSGNSAWYGHNDPRAFGAWCELWTVECLRVLKPGGHLLAFGGTRTWHRLACAVEDAGFEMRDSIAWLMGSGFPKSRNASRDLDPSRCRCSIESPYGSEARVDSTEQVGGSDLSDMQEGVSPLTDEAARRSTSSLLASMPGNSGRRPTSGDGAAWSSGLDGRTSAPLRHGEPRMEGWGNHEAPEGELQGSEVRSLSSGVGVNGDAERVHRGASVGHGSVGGPGADAPRDGEPHRPGSVEQRPVELGAVPNERRSQAWGGWPVCERCDKPVVPDGLGTALKPAFEPVVVARKPLVGNVAQNVLAYGTGALNIDATRIGYASESDRNAARVPMADFGPGAGSNDLPAYRARGRRGDIFEPPAAGRWPANVVLDAESAAALDQQSGITTSPTSTGRGASAKRTSMAGALGAQGKVPAPGDTGGASRFFYVAKAPKSERPVVDGIAHATVKPLTLMRWLVRLVTPPGGTVLDPFAGSGTTVEAAILEGFDVIGIEREADYLPLIQARIERASGPRCQWRTTEQCTYRQGHEGPCSMPFVEPESEAEEVAKVVSDVWDLFS